MNKECRFTCHEEIFKISPKNDTDTIKKLREEITKLKKENKKILDALNALIKKYENKLGDK